MSLSNQTKLNAQEYRYKFSSEEFWLVYLSIFICVYIYIHLADFFLYTWAVDG